MIPPKSADLGEDGASRVGMALAVEQELAEGHELIGMSIGVGVEYSGMVVGSTPLRPFKPDTAVVPLCGRSQGIELLLEVDTHL